MEREGQCPFRARGEEVEEYDVEGQEDIFGNREAKANKQIRDTMNEPPQSQSDYSVIPLAACSQSTSTFPLRLDTESTQQIQS